ncbi:MAG TPA: long-chain fatty acid--CoA ligase [Micavibrio sp.]|nr:long-chain fatty acid--CoA ligase [Micavibrio sp.]HIL29489.1 long-chain fatty acid--CoA ligase [Micavibrio sp.]
MTKDNHEWPWLKKYPEKVDWYAEIKPRPVYEMLETTAKEFGDRPAFNFLGKKWNWSEIENLVNKMAKGLQEQGVKKGVHVGVFLPNSPYFVIAYYAVLKAGGTVVNYNPLYVERELEYQIEDSETDIMITADLKLLYDKAHKLLHSSRLKKLVVCSFTDILPFPKNILFKLVKGKELAELEHPDDYVLFSDIIKNDGKPADPGIDPENDLAVLQYTGGTTGVPKGAMLTHYNVVSNVDQAVLWCYKTEFGIEKMVGVLPFFHVFAMTAVMNLSVRAGLEIIALPRFDLDQTLKLVDKYKPHFLPAVPAIYSAINNHKDLASFDLKSLRYCISGGAPLPVEVKKKFEANTGCVVSEGYGLTETAPIVCVNPIEGENKAGSIGLPMPQTIVELIDAETGEIVTKPGERGELCVRGPQVMKGYWNKPEDSASSIKDGRLHTGDVATMDEDGYVFIVDRIKDMIITNGYNVYPRYVEEAIYLHPNVEECIVAGVPDASRGEIVKAWIKPKEGRELSVEDMKDFLADKLSKIQIPRQFEIRNEALPKTMIGKLSRKDILKEEADKAA